MLHHTSQTLGADLRALRKARGMTLSELAGDLGRSVGWLSQVERDLSDLSNSDLRQLGKALDVPVSMLARHQPATSEEEGFVVRSDARRPLAHRVDGLVEGLLSPDMTDDFEMVHSIFGPGTGIDEPVRRPTQEVAYLMSGKLELTIGERSFSIRPGDSFRIRGEPYMWANPYPDPAIAIWVIAPPVY